MNTVTKYLVRKALTATLSPAEIVAGAKAARLILQRRPIPDALRDRVDALHEGSDANEIFDLLIEVTLPQMTPASLMHAVKARMALRGTTLEKIGALTPSEFAMVPGVECDCDGCEQEEEEGCDCPECTGAALPGEDLRLN